MFWQSLESFGSAGVSMHWPDGVEQPAMEGAAQAAMFEPAEGEVGAAMRAVAIDQAVASGLVAEQHEVFAEQFDGTDRARALQLVDQRRRLPVAPHQLAAGVLRAGAGDQVVLLLAHHGGVRPLSERRIVRLLNEWANYAMPWIRRQALFCRMFHGPMPKLKRKRERGTRDGFRREPRSRPAPAAMFRRDQRPDDAERSRPGRRAAARHRAAHAVHAPARRLRRRATASCSR